MEGTLGEREEGCQGHSCPGAPPPIILRSTAFHPIRKQNERVSGSCSTPRNEPQEPIFVAEHNPTGCSKSPFSKAAADESTGGVASGLR